MLVSEDGGGNVINITRMRMRRMMMVVMRAMRTMMRLILNTKILCLTLRIFQAMIRIFLGTMNESDQDMITVRLSEL